jgi:methyl acetate hydrolase
MMQSKLDSLLHKAVSEGKIPAVAAIVLDKSGEVLYRNIFGSSNVTNRSAPALTDSTPMMLFSCTKIFTTVAALQLVEQGKLGLNDPVEKFVPAMKEIKVIEGFGEDGKPILREPKTKATVLHLMTHTAGFSYHFLDETIRQWEDYAGNPAAGTRAKFMTPLRFDPGEKYTYGVNTDWLGWVIEGASGMPLDKYVEKNIIDPLGLKNTTPYLKDGETSLLVHMRDGDGKLFSNAQIAGIVSFHSYDLD